MRISAILVAVLALTAIGPDVSAAGSIRLAQSSIVTNCMMTCNSEVSVCQSSCVLPAVQTTTPGITGNATANTTCLLNCSTAQLACQTSCARQSPSQ